MPVIKRQLERMRVIDELLTRKTYPDITKIMGKCREYNIGVASRTVEKDIMDMKLPEPLGYNAPIRYDLSKKGYYYEDPEFSIDNLPLKDEEIDALIASANFLQRFKGASVFKNYSGAIEKIQKKLNVNRKTDISFVEFEQHPPLKGIEFLDELIDSIQHKRVLRIEYQKYADEKPSPRIIHPVYLKEYRGFWYLIGSKGHAEFVTLALDRIKDIVIQPALKYNSGPFNANEYYKYVVGVNVGNEIKPEKVVVSFLKGTGFYIEAQPLHHSQKLNKSKGDEMTFEFEVNINHEFISEIFKWMPLVRVEKPVSLKKKFISMLKEGLQQME